MGKLILAQSSISTETSRLIYTANQMTSFYVKLYIELKWVNSNGYICIVMFSPQDFLRNWNLCEALLSCQVENRNSNLNSFLL